MTGPDQVPTATPDLRCPVCWDPITARLVYSGGWGSDHRDLDGYECDNFRCGAEWDKHGRSTVRSCLTVPAHPVEDPQVSETARTLSSDDPQ